uniref:hypothetical protein n=1 Tax=Alloprevotella sp. TaxID=1872471 RepID=UPI004025DFB5
MKSKYDILMYVAAILGGVLGAYLCANRNGLGVVIAIICTTYIIGHIVMSWDAARAKREREKIAAKKKIEEKRRLELEEKERKYNIAKNELFARNGEPCKTIVISESRLDLFNINNELIVFDKAKKLWLCGHEVSIDDINSFAIDDESVVLKGQIKAVTSTNTGSLAGRSIAGALIGGEAGAIIGGSTAKKETIFEQENDKVIHDYALFVNLCDLNNPMLLIKIGANKNKAMEINALMQAIMAMK